MKDPAFPEPRGGGCTPGMSLRDYFAAQALIGILSGPLAPHLAAIAEERGHEASDALAMCAFEYADSMLSERRKK